MPIFAAVTLAQSTHISVAMLHVMAVVGSGPNGCFGRTLHSSWLVSQFSPYHSDVQTHA